MRRTLPMIVGMGLALAGVGCGDGGAADEVSVDAPLDLLSAVEEEGSARVSFRLDDDGLSEELDADVWGRWQMRVEMEGVAAFGEVRTSLSGTFEMGMVLPEGAVDDDPAPLAWETDLRSIGDEVWMRETREGEQGPWVREPDPHDEELEEVGEPVDGDGLEEGELAEDGGDEEGDDDPFSLLDPASLDPAGFVEALRDAAEEFTAAGSGDVRGDAATRYEVTVDESIGEEGEWYGLDGQVEVWIDAQDRLRRVRGGALEMELWDFGVPVDVEPPADAVDYDEADDVGAFALPEVTGDWVVQAEGTTGDRAWQVFAAPARQGDADVACRTLEVVGAEDVPGNWLDGEDIEEEGLPNHDGVLATCGSGAGFFGGPTSDPALQVFGDDSFTSESTRLVAFVVSERFRGGPVRIVLDGADPVELALDATGLAVWDGSGTETIEAIELDGGAVRCPVRSMFDGGEEPEEEGYEEHLPPGAEQLWSGTAPCVRA